MKKSIYIILSLCLVGLFYLDLAMGSVWINPLGNHSSLDMRILMDIRLPKAITAVLAGAALSMSGLMMQTLFRNPLAGPYILGVSSGAGLGVALVTMCAGWIGLSSMGTTGSIAMAAILGALVVLAIVMALARRVKENVTLLIVGMMIGSIAGALVSLVQNYANPDSLKLFIVWTLGSLSAVGWQQLGVLSGIVLLGTVITIGLIKPLNGLVLGEKYARSLGVNIEKTRRWMVVATGLLAGGVTAYCGPIAFIGVAVPHLVRGLWRSNDHRITVPGVMLMGAGMLLVCDILSGLSTYPLPISTVSALFGAPVIIAILMRRS